MVQRDAQVVLKILNDVKIKTIQPIVQKQIKQYSKIYTDEYAIYNWLSDFYYHKTVNHVQKNMHEMMIMMVFVKFTSIPVEDFGHSLGHGLDLIEVFHKKDYQHILAFLKLFIMLKKR